MNVSELSAWLNRRLETGKYAGKDPSWNGLQAGDARAPVQTAAFAVDACLESIRRAAEAGADILIVHHGFFWGEPVPLTGSHYGRVKTLFDAGIALYAAHIPLDAHPEIGHNACIARAVGLTPESLRPFGEWRGMTIGLCGDFPEEENLDRVLAKLFPDGAQPAHILPFGPEKTRSAGIVSGGGGSDLEQAVKAGLDLFITGEIGHEQYHLALESGISVIAGGHYQTETFGLKALEREIAAELNLRTVFLDVPTGL